VRAAATTAVRPTAAATAAVSATSPRFVAEEGLRLPVDLRGEGQVAVELLLGRLKLRAPLPSLRHARLVQPLVGGLVLALALALAR
jgi:hypothetical protein